MLNVARRAVHGNLHLVNVLVLVILLSLLALIKHSFFDIRFGAHRAWADAGETTQESTTILLELTEAPVAEIYARTVAHAAAGLDRTEPVTAATIAAATAAHLTVVDHQQHQVLATLSQHVGSDVQVVYRVQRVYNGIAVRIAPEHMAILDSLPGVKATHRVVSKRPLNNRSIPHIGAPEIWSRSQGDELTGTGITIAIIDTGIDYLHVDFGGPGAGYEANDPTRLGEVAGFPGVKIVDGYDFAGESYNADPKDSNYHPIPQPDPDPMDCYGSGHGTHVAGTAAGFGVTEQGQTYQGPYHSDLDFTSFLIGPGVAPQATLYAVKVFGCSGTSEIVDLGIEWAVDPNGDGDFSDHVDVINLSLGSSYGVTYDATTLAAERAAQIGVIVVASAGNDGDTFYTVGSPSVGDRVISVAATAAAYGNAAPAEALHDSGALFSARGPRRLDSMLKPDVAAPGHLIRSAQRGTASGSYVASGTSMAAPHVSGSLALLRQLYPDPDVSGVDTIANWSVLDLKALLMNTADTEIRAGSEQTATLLSPVRVGGGSINLPRVLETKAIAYNGDNPGLVSVSFGAPSVVDQLSLSKNIYLENKSAEHLTYTLHYSAVVDMPGVTFQLPSAVTLTVPMGARVSFPLLLQADAQAMEHSRDAALALTQRLPRHWLSEEAGYLVLRPVGTGTVLRLPLYAAPRRASQLYSRPAGFDIGVQEEVELTIALAGQPIVARAPNRVAPEQAETHVSAFMLQHVSVNEDPAYADPVIPPGRTDHADIKYVGVSRHSDESSGKTEVAQTVFFAVATHAPWSTPKTVEFDFLIDTNADGQDDYRVYNSDSISYIIDNLVTDSFVTIVEDLATQEETIEGFLYGLPATEANMAPYNTNLLILPVRAAAIGLTAQDSTFYYRVRSYSVDISYGVVLDRYVDETPKMFYDLARPGLVSNGQPILGPIYSGTPGSTIPFQVVAADYARVGGKGIMLFYHQNLLEEQIEIKHVELEHLRSVYLPLVAAPVAE